MLGMLLATAALHFAVIARAAPAPTLRVATGGDYARDYAPFSRDGAGFDIERAPAKDLGYRIQWASFRWPDLESVRMRAHASGAQSARKWCGAPRWQPEGEGWRRAELASVVEGQGQLTEWSRGGGRA